MTSIRCLALVGFLLAALAVSHAARPQRSRMLNAKPQDRFSHQGARALMDSDNATDIYPCQYDPDTPDTFWGSACSLNFTTLVALNPAETEAIAPTTYNAYEEYCGSTYIFPVASEENATLVAEVAAQCTADPLCGVGFDTDDDGVVFFQCFYNKLDYDYYLRSSTCPDSFQGQFMACQAATTSNCSATPGCHNFQPSYLNENAYPAGAIANWTAWLGPLWGSLDTWLCLPSDWYQGEDINSPKAWLTAFQNGTDILNSVIQTDDIALFTEVLGTCTPAQMYWDWKQSRKVCRAFNGDYGLLDVNSTTGYNDTASAGCIASGCNVAELYNEDGIVYSATCDVYGEDAFLMTPDGKGDWMLEPIMSGATYVCYDMPNRWNETTCLGATLPRATP